MQTKQVCFGDRCQRRGYSSTHNEEKNRKKDEHKEMVGFDWKQRYRLRWLEIEACCGWKVYKAKVI